MTSVEKMLRTSRVPVLLDQSLRQHVKQIRQHQRLRQQQHHRLVVNRAVVVDVVVLVRGQSRGRGRGAKRSVADDPKVDSDLGRGQTNHGSEKRT